MQFDLDQQKPHGIPRIKKMSYNNNPNSYSLETGLNNGSLTTTTTNSSRISTRPSVNVKHLLNEPNESVTTDLSLKAEVDNHKL